MCIRFLLCLFLGVFPLAAGKFEKKIAVLYDSLNPSSLTELFAFYHLYPDTLQGKRAYDKAWELINRHRNLPVSPLAEVILPDIDIDAFVYMITKQAGEAMPTLSERILAIVDHMTSHLHHKGLKGHHIWTKEEAQALPTHEIDLARTLLIHEFGNDSTQRIRSYEAYIDLMALQVLATLPRNPTHLQLVEAISHYIFHEMRFRFPPHSMWAKDVDLYTFLPAVLDSRHGVCLGVSILYLSIAQRLNLPLEIVTPPGHIYVSYRKEDGTVLNIETTARGIDLPDERYLGINTCRLQRRTLKEVVGMNFFNAAATEWHKKNYQRAIELYKEAQAYLPNDPLVQTFMGYNYLFLDREEEAKPLLEQAVAHPPIDHIYPETAAADYLAGYVDGHGIKVVYQEVDETRESILQKQQNLLQILDKWPKFREGLFHTAVTYLQLGRSKEALTYLRRYHEIDSHNPTVEYYLGILCLNRFAFKEGVKHIKLCHTLVNSKGHYPLALRELKATQRQTTPFY